MRSLCRDLCLQCSDTRGPEEGVWVHRLIWLKAVPQTKAKITAVLPGEEDDTSSGGKIEEPTAKRLKLESSAGTEKSNCSGTGGPVSSPADGGTSNVVACPDSRTPEADANIMGTTSSTMGGCCPPSMYYVLQLPYSRAAVEVVAQYLYTSKIEEGLNFGVVMQVHQLAKGLQLEYIEKYFDMYFDGIPPKQFDQYNAGCTYTLITI